MVSEMMDYTVERGRFYRAPEEIRLDMRQIAEKMRSIEERLSVRDMIVHALYRAESPEVWIPTLSAIVSDAKSALDTLLDLKEELLVLSEELSEVRNICL